MRAFRAFLVVAVVGWFGASAELADAALAKAKGGSGYSGTLSSNKAIRKQQLIADPDSPTSGSTSTSYDPTIVSFAGLTFGPGYFGGGVIEIYDGEVTDLYNINTWLASPFGTETGYVQVFYTDVPPTFAPAAAAMTSHGQITPPPGYVQVDRAGPVSVDTHAMFFNYLPSVNDGAIAEYTIYADGQREDYMSGIDEQGNPFTLYPGQIDPVTVRGSLNAVPLPPAVFAGAVCLTGMFFSRKLIKRRFV